MGHTFVNLWNSKKNQNFQKGFYIFLKESIFSSKQGHEIIFTFIFTHLIWSSELFIFKELEKQINSLLQLWTKEFTLFSPMNTIFGTYFRRDLNLSTQNGHKMNFWVQLDGVKCECSILIYEIITLPWKRKIAQEERYT